MSRESVLIVLGVVTGLAPFSGFPVSWLAWILPAVGIAVIVIGVSFKTQKILATIPAEDHGSDS